MAASTEKADPAVGAWKSILELVGWGSRVAPRFPLVAMELDLSPKQLGVLWRLEPGSEGLPMREIASSLYCDASYVTDMVDRLEERKLIERRPSAADRRVKLLGLTGAGEQLRERALEMLYTPPEGFDRLSATEQRTLAELLTKVSE
ncbi:MAG TPA: MarR family transcriptional regulator [Solirubrobacterales bacterium]|nr:MarR family transcriptional regulator [Solirubrobacterales bacterium]